MKIVFDSQIFQFQTYGGVSRYFVELARQIPLLFGDSIQLKILAPFYVNHYLREHKNQLSIFGTHVDRMRGIRHINEVLCTLVSPVFSSDIIHETYYSQKPFKGKSTRRVLTVYDMMHERFPDYFSDAAIVQGWKQAAINRADHIISISHHTKSDLVNLLNVDPDRVTVVHMGLPDKQTASGVQSAPATPFLLYVGQRKGYKNFEGFLRAYAASEKLRKNVALIAFGGGAFSSQEKELMRSLRLSPEMVIQKSGADRELYQLYGQALAFVCPSLYEGFGMPLLEAMAFSCPVVCSNTSSIPEVAGQAAVFFQPDDPESVKEVLELVCEDSGLRQTLISKGLERTTHFSWRKCAEETVAVYQNLLQQ